MFFKSYLFLSVHNWNPNLYQLVSSSCTTTKNKTQIQIQVKPKFCTSLITSSTYFTAGFYLFDTYMKVWPNFKWSDAQWWAFWRYLCLRNWVCYCDRRYWNQWVAVLRFLSPQLVWRRDRHFGINLFYKVMWTGPCWLLWLVFMDF